MKVKVSSKGQISIPSRFRKRLKVEAGDEISVIESGDALIIYPDKTRNKEELLSLFNRLNGAWSDLEQDGIALVREMRKGGTRDVWQ